MFLVAGSAYSKTVTDNPAFMMVGGISAAAEMCLAAGNGDIESFMFSWAWLAACRGVVGVGVGTEGAAVALEPCAAAVAAGDGRELWQTYCFLLRMAQHGEQYVDLERAGTNQSMLTRAFFHACLSCCIAVVQAALAQRAACKCCGGQVHQYLG